MEKKYLIAPGPTPVPEEARLAMARQLIHHRGPEFKEVMGEVRQGLKWLYETEQDVLVLTCSGTGAFEATIANFTSRGEKIISIGGGKFGDRWGNVARAFGLEVIDVALEWGDFMTPQALGELLEKHPETTMVTVSASETSTGTFHPVKELGQVVRENSKALFVVDGITAVGVHRVPMDEWGIDILLAGSQKAFGVPPGLAFLAASERAWERADASDHSRFYFDLRRERARQGQNQTAFTPAISIVLAIQEVLRLMQKEGREALLERHRLNAEATQAAVKALGLRLLSKSPSLAVTAALVPEGVSAKEIVARLREQEGVTIAGGQDDYADSLIRIGHIGFFAPADILVAIGALERVMQSMDMPIELGAGLRAAQKVFSS